MRDAFIKQLVPLAKDDPRVVVVAGDIGNRMFDEFREACPDRFINAGIAEADMTGMAAGLAMAGLRPFTYTIAAFNPGRCFEQIRLDICQHNLPVTVVGVGAGLSYSSLGPTHHALEDIALMRALPNMTVLCPGDPLEAQASVKVALAHDGPVYLRLGKKGEPSIHRTEPSLRIGKALEIRKGADIALLAVGTVLPAALAAAEKLAESGVSAAVYSFHSVKPMDKELLARLFGEGGVKAVAVVEEHVAAGGAWSAVAEWLAERGGTHVPLIRVGTPDAFFHEAGNQLWARQRMGIEPGAIAGRMLAALEGAR